MSDQSARLGLPYLMPSQAQKHVTHNEALARLDLLVQLVVQAFDAATPPSLPQDGQIWALGGAPTGDWAGQARALAAWVNGAWMFIAPQEGWRAARVSADGAELRLFTAGGWIVPGPDALDNLAGLGINTAHDATNRLAVAGDATLLSHAGAGHQLKINKADASDTGSVLFQTGWSGRAEMGLAGDDDWSIKVSADGASWTEALRIDAATGTAQGTAVQQSATDTTPGRVLKLDKDGGGAFGLGSTSAVGPPEITDFTDVLVPGFYRYTESLATGAPGTGAGFAGYAVVLRTNSGHPGAFAWRRTMNAANLKVWFGTRAGATGAMLWNELWHQGNLLGTVSQSGGTPTGSVIQRGSNANGRFMRFADGTQICLSPDLATPDINDVTGAIFRSASIPWTFPAAFHDIPQIQVQALTANAWGLPTQNWSTTGGTYRVARASSLNTESLSRAMAVGRWFNL